MNLWKICLSLGYCSKHGWQYGQAKHHLVPLFHLDLAGTKLFIYHYTLPKDRGLMSQKYYLNSPNTIFEGNIQSLVAVVTMGHYSSWYTFGSWFCFSWTNMCIPMKSFIFPKIILFFIMRYFLAFILPSEQIHAST